PLAPRFLPTVCATTVSYTLSLHDALPICVRRAVRKSVLRAEGRRHVREVPDLEGGRRVRHGTLRTGEPGVRRQEVRQTPAEGRGDRKSTRLNSSHVKISYAVFCLKNKKHE